MKACKTAILSTSLLLIVSCTTTGPQVKAPSPLAGDVTSEMHYTCRLDDGDIIVTTEPDVARDEALAKSPLFIEKSTYRPVNLAEAKRAAAENQHIEELKGLEEVLIERLAAVADQMPINTEKRIRVDAEAQDNVPRRERTLWLARLKKRAKSEVYSLDMIERLTTAKPVVGEAVHLEPALDGRVIEVTENQVTVAYAPLHDDPLEGDFGPMRVVDKGDYYQIEIDATVGHRVKVGPLVGRIAEVEETRFRVDYSHPFGGGTLICDLRTRPIAKPDARATAQLPAGKQDALAAGAMAAGMLAGNTGAGTRGANTGGPANAVTGPGDLVEVGYTASLESGEVIWTTDAHIAADPGTPKLEGYQMPETLGPETIVLGEKGSFPGLDDAVRGMHAGETRRITLPPEQTFGESDPNLIKKYDRTKSMPRSMTFSAEEYVKIFGGFPVKGKSVDYNTYVDGKVVDVNEKGAVVEFTPKTDTLEERFGTTRIRRVADRIEIFLTPKMGAQFSTKDQTGTIVSADDRQFTVDFSSPLVGKNIVFDVDLKSVVKADTFEDMQIAWIDDYAEGLEALQAANKPAVLVLYADWCGYCKKLLTKTMVDPRIKMMHDDFIWVKANSDKDPSLKELYEQKGFPLTVVLDGQGEIIGRIDGFRPAAEYRTELQKLMRADHQAASKADEAVGSGS